MKTTRLRGILLLAFLLVASRGHGAEISWTLPTRYKDGKPIAPAEARKIVVEVYWGPAKEGPWEPVASSYPGGTTATVPDPPPARTRWYTAKSTLDGAESDFAVPVRRTNYSLPIPPLLKKVAKKAVERRKMVLLVILALILGLGGMIRLRRKRRRR